MKFSCKKTIVLSAFALTITMLASIHGTRCSSKLTIAQSDLIRFETAVLAYKLNNETYPVLTNRSNLVLVDIRKMTPLYLDHHSGINTNSWEWIDPWNKPYHVEIRGITMDKKTFNDKFGWRSEDVVAWSSGVNATNEYGRGDDITSNNSISRRPPHGWGCQAK